MKRLSAWMVLFCMLLGCARAENALHPDQFLFDFDGEKPIRCTVTADVEKVPGVSDPALEALQGLVKRLSLVMDVQEGMAGENAGFTLYDGENALWTVGSKTEDGVTASFVGGEWFLTPEGEGDALSLLGGTAVALPHLKDGREAFWASFDQMYAALEQADARVSEVKATTSLANVGASGRYIGYKLNADQMNGTWEDILSVLAPSINALCPDTGAHLLNGLAQLVFTGDTEIRRIRDKEENEWGIRVTTNAGTADQVDRKITLIIAWRPERGFNIELKAPAKDESQPFRLFLTGAYLLNGAEEKWTLEGAYIRLENGTKTTTKLEGSVKCTAEEEGGRLHGKLTFTQGNDTYKITPDLVCTDDGMKGDITYSAREQKGETALTLHVDMAYGSGWQAPEGAMIDLAGMEVWEKEFILRDVDEALQKDLVRLLAALDDTDRALITHVWRTDNWHTGQSVPVPEDGNFRRVEEDVE